MLLKPGPTGFLLRRLRGHRSPGALRSPGGSAWPEARHASDAFGKGDRYFRALIENSADAIALCSPDGTILYTSPSTTKILGWIPQELLGTNAFDLVHEDDQDRLVRDVTELLQQPGSGVKVQGRARHRDGTWRWLEGVFTNLLHDPDVRGIVNNYRDITERKQVEEAQRESQEQVRLLLDSTAEGIYGLDLDGVCTFSNQSCARLLGYDDPLQLVGKNMHALIHHTRADGTPCPSEECRIFQAFRQGKGTHVDTEVLWRADETSFPAEYWSYPIRRKGEVVGSVVTFLDISQRKKAEESLRESEERFRLMFASNPLPMWVYRRGVPTFPGGK